VAPRCLALERVDREELPGVHGGLAGELDRRRGKV
jgi:hypothetical protein